MDVQKTHPRRIALIDGNSFYCSCERVMRPSYEGKPLVSLSSNDGCVISRTQEAKNLGIKMGDPWFKVKHLEHTHGLIALSANFSLYGDLSHRMMNVIGQFSHKQEIYSIDESWLDLTGVPGTGRELGTSIRDRVQKWVGIPTCVGIGSTKTLAKASNHLAKKHPRLLGVCDLTTIDAQARITALRHVPVEDVWGIGRRLTPKLQAMNIKTAADLAQADTKLIRDRFSIVVEKTVRELRGESCIAWEDEPSDKKQIMCSRTFGKSITELSDLVQAVSVFVTRVAEKLRAQKSHANAVQVFIRTSLFRNDPQYSGSTVVRMSATSDTNALISSVAGGLRAIYRPGFKYAKAGVCLMDIQPADQAGLQLDLFAAPSAAKIKPRAKLMDVMDQLNTRYGRSTLVSAAALSDITAPWQMKRERMTQAYTTNWADIIEIWK